MKRRELFTSIFKEQNESDNSTITGKYPIDLSLDTYSGIWNHETATHLLNRTTFGVTSNYLNNSIEIGLNKTIEQLFTKQKPPNPPVNYDCNIDPFVPIGETWINAPYGSDAEILEYRKRSLFCWIMNILNQNNISITEQLTFFWHNYFSVFDITEHKSVYLYSSFLRNEAFGNFKKIINYITISPAMLEFLNGDKNIKQSPNENYARELLELYTVGKGVLVKEGDYTTFTEKDVSEIAKILTGWEIKGRLTTNPTDNNKAVLESIFNVENHDATQKTLSPRLKNKKVENKNEKEYSYLIDILLEQEIVAENICKKIYRWFVNSTIDSDIELNIIKPLAKMLYNNGYEIQPILKKLLSSNHFYNNIHNFSKIKNPYEFVFAILNKFQVKSPTNLSDNISYWHQVFNLASSMGMEYYVPPNVAGWKAYYQAPLYDNIWINASTLQKRKIFVQKIVEDGINISDGFVRINIYENIKKLNKPEEIKECVYELIHLLFTKSLSQEHLKNIELLLLNGCSYDEWNQKIINYKMLKLDKQDADFIESNWKNAIKYVLTIPEYNFI